MLIQNRTDGDVDVARYFVVCAGALGYGDPACVRHLVTRASGTSGTPSIMRGSSPRNGVAQPLDMMRLRENALRLLRAAKPLHAASGQIAKKSENFFRWSMQKPPEADIARPAGPAGSVENDPFETLCFPRSAY